MCVAFYTLSRVRTFCGERNMASLRKEEHEIAEAAKLDAEAATAWATMQWLLFKLHTA